MSFAMKYLDGEKLYKAYWVEMGNARSYDRLVNWAAANKMVNPKTGKTTRMGVWKAMYRWAVNNPEKAYDYMNEGLRDSGEIIDRERFIQEMKEKVLTSYQSDNFTKRWAKANGYK